MTSLSFRKLRTRVTSKTRKPAHFNYNTRNPSSKMAKPVTRELSKTRKPAPFSEKTRIPMAKIGQTRNPWNPKADTVHSFHFFHFFILNYLNTKSLQQYKVTKEKSLIIIIHYNIYIFTVYLSKTYYEAAALPGSRVFVFFQLLK